jgi:hypothetical protein
MPSKKATEKKQVAKPKSDIFVAADLISPSLDFSRKNFKDLLIKYIKVYLAYYLAAPVLILILGLITLLPLMLLAGGIDNIGNYISSNSPISILLLIWLAIVYVFVIWITFAIHYIRYPITHEQFEKKYSGIWPVFNRIKFPSFGFMVLNFTFGILSLLIPVVLLLVFFGQSTISNIGILVIYFVWLFFMGIFLFLTQFWIWELLIEKKGLIESLKYSLQLVVKNFLPVLVFDAILVAAWMIFYTVYMAVSFLLPVFFGMIAVIASTLPSYFFLATIILGVIAFLLLITVLLSILEVFTLPFTYSFWRRIRKQ